MREISPSWPKPEKSVVAVGLFDGVHRGHRYLLGRLLEWSKEVSAKPVVITFTPHPQEILTGNSPPLVVSPHHRVRLLNNFGIARVWLLPVDKAFLGLKSEDFFRIYLKEALNAAGLLVGFDNKIGSDHADAAQLKKTGEE